jgi:hypothetical protein
MVREGSPLVKLAILLGSGGRWTGSAEEIVAKLRQV